MSTACACVPKPTRSSRTAARLLAAPRGINDDVSAQLESLFERQRRRERHVPRLGPTQYPKAVVRFDVLECPHCQGPMRILAAIHPPDTTRKILEHLGLPSRAPPLAPAVSEPEPPALEADFID